MPRKHEKWKPYDICARSTRMRAAGGSRRGQRKEDKLLNLRTMVAQYKARRATRRCRLACTVQDNKLKLCARAHTLHHNIVKQCARGARGEPAGGA